VGCTARPSATPLASSAEAGSEVRADRRAPADGSTESPAGPEPVAEGDAQEVAPVVAGPPAPPPSGPASFLVLGKGQTLTRRLALELSFDMSVDDDGQAMSVHVSGHGDQEVRFQVLSTEGGVPSELELFYVRDHMSMEAMGHREEEPQPNYGNRYFAVVKGKSVEVRSAGGKKLTEEELDTARTDAQELFTMQAAMAAASAKSKGMAVAPDAVVPEELLRSLASDDDQVKITNRKGAFRSFQKLASGETSALADVSFDLSFDDDELTLSGSMKGTAVLGTSPWRALDVKVEGPVTLHGKDPEDGVEMKGGGRVRLGVTYVY
jgi:hypothetical protein